MIDKVRIESIASTIYAKHCQRGIPAKMLEKIIKAEGIKLREIDGGEKFLGALTKGMTGTPYIMINKNITNIGRKNFTTAHELGHHAMEHHLQAASFICGESEITEDGEAVTDQEKEANYFASYFLLPRDRVHKEFEKWYNWRFPASTRVYLYVDPHDKKSYHDWKVIDGKLTKMFNVSTAALKICLIELALINNFH
jgi:Zn-dependent peptidase ImmA (M78 family)